MTGFLLVLTKDYEERVKWRWACLRTKTQPPRWHRQRPAFLGPVFSPRDRPRTKFDNMFVASYVVVATWKLHLLQPFVTSASPGLRMGWMTFVVAIYILPTNKRESFVKNDHAIVNINNNWRLRAFLPHIAGLNCSLCSGQRVRDVLFPSRKRKQQETLFGLRKKLYAGDIQVDGCANMYFQ